GRAGTDAGHAFAVLDLGYFWQRSTNLFFAVIRGDAFQAADRDGFLFDASASTGRLAGTIADASKDAGEDVRCAIDQVRFGVASLTNQANVFGNIGVSRTGPLAVDYLMEVVGVTNVGRLHLDEALSSGRLSYGGTASLLARLVERKHSSGAFPTGICTPL